MLTRRTQWVALIVRETLAEIKLDVNQMTTYRCDHKL